MSVESFDPGASSAHLTDAALERLLEVSEVAVSDAPSDDSMGLTALERSSMAGLMTAPAADWQRAVEGLQSEQIESLR